MNISRIFRELNLALKALVKLPLAGAWTYCLFESGLSADSPGFVNIQVGPEAWISLRRNQTDVKIFQQIFLLDDCRISVKGFHPKTIVDGGAHIGCAAVWFALHYPDATIIAVEAEPRNFTQLSHNAARFPNIKPVHAAISGHQGWATVANPGDEEWAFRMKLSGEQPGSIPMVTINELVRDYGAIDLLKLDIEGSEVDVFSANTDWLKKVTAINIELHDRYRPGCSEAFERAVAGYDAERERTEHNVIWVNRAS